MRLPKFIIRWINQHKARKYRSAFKKFSDRAGAIMNKDKTNG